MGLISWFKRKPAPPKKEQPPPPTGNENKGHKIWDTFAAQNPHVNDAKARKF